MSIFGVATTGGGSSAAYPDACKTPAPTGVLPVPYPNTAQCSDGGGSSKVKIENKEVLRKGDEIRMSAGDEAGSAMGVKSNKIKGACTFKGGSSKVKVEGKEVAHQTVAVAHNGSNANMPQGTHVSSSQTKVKVS